MPTIPGLRPGEVRAGRRRQRRTARAIERKPNVLTAREFGAGLKASGHTAGQNFREAARKRLTAEGVSAADIDARVKQAVLERRSQRSAVRSSGVDRATRNMALRRLQAGDVNYLRRQSPSAAQPTIRVRSRGEVMDYRNPAKRAAKRRAGHRARMGGGVNSRRDIIPLNY